jgi:hypothetical protein
MLLLAATPSAPSFSYTPVVVAVVCAIGVGVAARRNDREGAGCGCLSTLIVVFVAAGAGWDAGPGVTLFALFAVATSVFLLGFLARSGVPMGFAPSRSRRPPEASPPPPAPPKRGRVAYPDADCPGCGAPYEPDDARCRFCSRPRAGA